MLTLRPANEEDKDFVRRLNADSYKAVVGAQFGLWDDGAEQEVFERKWAEQQYQIVERDGQRLGVIWTTRETDHIWLREIQVCPSHRNRGMGTALITQLTDEARALQVPLRLRVLTANRAKALYERLGFRVTGLYEDSHYWMEYDPSSS